MGVRNTYRTRDGRTDVADGVARPLPGMPGALQVRFVPDWLAWLPFTWADDWVVELNPDYRWAVVGSPSRDSLWVLSRTPAMPRAQFEAIRARAAQRGDPVQHLVLPPGTLE